MSKKTVFVTQAGLIAALYVVLSYAQVFLAPTTVYSAIQFRISEALMVLCLYSPSAVFGLTVGCMIVNIANAPIDILIGGLATLLAGVTMYLLRNVRIFKLPILSAFMPAIFNGILISFEINFFFTDSFEIAAFLLSAFSIFIGEIVVLLVIGLPLVSVLERYRLDKRFFK